MKPGSEQALSTAHRIVSTLLVVALLAVAPSVAEASPTKIAWSKCHEQFGTFECGQLQVPLDYDEPNGATISIALVRRPATDPAHRIGTLFLNPGGPGGSGVDFALNMAGTLYSSEVRARFDLVGFDPRGIGRSTPARCYGTDRQWAGLDEPPNWFPRTAAEEQEWIGFWSRVIGDCRRHAGRIIEHMSTANVARDLDRLRQAVGDEKLTFAGYSYGSYLGVTYANLYPHRVRAVIVDGVLDPIAWSTGRGDEAASLPLGARLKSYAGAQATLDEFFRLCDAGGSRCAFAPNSAARFAALAERLEQQPLEGLDYTALVAATLGAMYRSSSWEGFAQLLGDIEAQTDREHQVARLHAFMDAPGFTTKRGFPRYRNWLEGGHTVMCSDSDEPDSYEAWSSAGAAADTASLFGRYWIWLTAGCAQWPFADADRYTGPFDRATANPVLVIGNRFDPSTPFHGARVVADLMPNSALLPVHAWGHISIRASTCAIEAASRYLLGIEVPLPGAVCRQDRTPFT